MSPKQMLRLFFTLTFTISGFFSTSLPAQAAPITGLAILGASESDEYRSPDENRGGTYGPVTFNWMEHLANTSSVTPNYYSQRINTRNINFGTWGNYGGTRRTGFAYNFARSGHQAHHLPSQLQSLLPLVSSGSVSHVVIFIGGNDFSTANGTYAAIYNGSMSDSELQQKITNIVTDIKNTVNSLKAANSNVKITVSNYGDAGLSPTIINQFPNPSLQDQLFCLTQNIPPGGHPKCQAAGRLRVSYAIIAVNEGLVSQLPSDVHITNLYDFTFSLLNQFSPDGYLYVGGIPINVKVKNNNPCYLQLNDAIGHGGTVISGLIANLFLSNLNSAFNTNIPLLSETEIVNNAGLHSASDCSGNPPTPSPTSAVTPPTPSSTPAPSPTSTPSPSGDVNGDGFVDYVDYQIALNTFGSSGPADLNQNGKVDVFDLNIIIADYGQAKPIPTTPHPTPTTTDPSPTSTPGEPALKAATAIRYQDTLPTNPELTQQILSMKTELQNKLGGIQPKLLLVFSNSHRLINPTGTGNIDFAEYLKNELGATYLAGLTSDIHKYPPLAEGHFQANNKHAVSVMALSGSSLEKVLMASVPGPTNPPRTTQAYYDDAFTIGANLGTQILSQIPNYQSKSNLLIPTGPYHGDIHVEKVLTGLRDGLASKGINLNAIKFLGAGGDDNKSASYNQTFQGQRSLTGTLISGSFDLALAGQSGFPQCPHIVSADKLALLKNELGANPDALIYIPGHPNTATGCGYSDDQAAYEAMRLPIADVFGSFIPTIGSTGASEIGHLTTTSDPAGVVMHMFVAGLKSP